MNKKKDRQQRKTHKKRKAKAKSLHEEVYGSWINKIKADRKPKFTHHQPGALNLAAMSMVMRGVGRRGF